MKKTRAALAAGVALSTFLVAAPAFAQFGMLGALASARANTSQGNAATNAVANAQAQAEAAAQAQALAFSPAGLPAASALVAPTPIAGNTGQYMSPFTAAGEPTGWVIKAAQGSTAGAIGAAASNYAADKVAEQAAQKMASMVPVPGLGFLASRATKSVGAAAGRGIAAQTAGGGEAFVKSSSDQSFNSLQDLAINLYVNHSARADYPQILAATAAVYPEFQAIYLPAVQSASLK